MFKVRASLNKGELYLSFDLHGHKEVIEGLMPGLLEQIQAGLDLAREKVKPEDLVEVE
jgi:hypothetical protein